MVHEQAVMMNEPADPFVIDPDSCAVEAVATSSSSPPPPPPPPYVTTGGSGAMIGKCHVHVNEFEDCKIDDSRDLSTEVTIWDVGGNQIGYQSSTEAGAKDPLSVNSKLEAPLVLVPEHRGDYIQFTLGTEAFTSQQTDQTADQWCSTGGWDPREGPLCPINIQAKSVSHTYLPNYPMP